MKIVHIITALGVGGAEKLLVNVANNQVKNHDVTVIYFKINTLLQDLDKEINVIHIPIKWGIVSKIKKELRKINPNVVHTHLTHADLFGLLAVKFLKNIKTYTTIHNTKYKHNFIDNFYYLLYIILFNVISPRTKIIAISKLLEYKINKELKVQKKRIKLLYNTISLAKEDVEDFPQNIIINKDKFKILYVGRLAKQKAVHNLIKAITHLEEAVKKDTIVFLVGQGELRSQLEKLVAELNLEEHILFEGLSNQVPTYMKNSDIFVLPSIFEGLPLVLVEAFYYGLPIVSSNIEGPVELIENYENGLLFEKNNSEDLAKKITELYSNKSLRKKFSEKGKLFYEENFNAKKYMNKLESIYRES